MRKIERWFETFLWNTRFIAVIAVLGLLVAALIAFFLGAKSVYYAVVSVLAYESLNVTLVYLISAIDEFLVGIVSFIISLGVYELFVSEIDAKKGQDMYPAWLQFNSLEELKSVLTKVIIIILMVFFFKTVIVMEFNSALSILYLGGGILLIALANYLTKKKV